MTTEQFTYWLQGFAEIQSSAPTEEQWTIIKDHLSTVFNKVTPNRLTQGQSTTPSQSFPMGPAQVQPYTPAPYNPPPGVRDFEKTAPFPYPTPAVIC